MKDKINNTFSSHNLFWIALGGFLLRLFQLGDKSLWQDEQWTYLIARKEIPDLFEYLFKMVDRPPLHLLLTHYSLTLGDTEFSLRMTSMIFGTLLIPLIYLTGKELWGEKEGILAAFLVALSPYHLNYSQEVTVYSLFCFFSLLTLYFFLRAFSRGGKNWIGFVLAAVGNLYSSYFAFLFLTSLGIIGIFLIRKDKTRTELRYLFLSFLAILLLYLPWTSVLFDLFGKYKGNNFNPEFNIGFNLIKNLTVEFSGTIFSLLLIFITLFYSLGKDKKFFWIFLNIFFLPLLILHFFKPKYYFNSRYLIFILPLIILAMARGLALIEKFSHKSFFYLALIVLLSLNLPTIYIYYQTERRDWRQATRFLEERLEDGDLIAMEPPYLYNPFFYYLNLDQYTKLKLIDPLHIIDPVEIETGGKTITVASSVKLMTPGLINRHQRLWYILSAEKYPNWVVKNFSLVKEIPGLKGFGSLRIYFIEVKDLVQNLHRSS